MSRLPSSSVSRSARLTAWRAVNVDGDTATSTDRQPSPTSLELDVCCRRNIVSDRTRFFEEKSRRPAATPLRRRSRSATPRLSRADPSDAATTRTTHVAATHAVPPTTVLAQSVPASTSISESALPVNQIGVNNANDQLKVITHLRQLTIVSFLTFTTIIPPSKFLYFILIQ